MKHVQMPLYFRYMIICLSGCLSSSLRAHWDTLDASATRAAYTDDASIGGSNKNSQTSSQEECCFCKQANNGDDAKEFILARFQHAHVILNRYPYRQGHMLVLPTRHVAKLQDLTPEEQLDFIRAVALAMKFLNEEYKTDGHNAGINEGKAGGASKPDHLHMHVVPRWNGDISFLHLIGQTSVLAEPMSKTYERLKAKFEAAEQEFGER